MCSTRSLEGWGWNSYFEAFWHGGGWENAVPARVVAQQRKFWRVAGDFSECWAEASGKLRLAADEGADWPAVGDWVAVELHGADTTAVIQGDRATHLIYRVRKSARSDLMRMGCPGGGSASSIGRRNTPAWEW